MKISQSYKILKMFWYFVFLINWNISARAGDGLRTLSAAIATQPPTIDGKLTDEVWRHAESGSEFIQQDPKDGQPATHDTSVQITFDRSNLYVAMTMIDPEPDKIKAILTRRDREVESDWCAVVFDSYHDHKTARFFMVNAAGIQRDGSFSGDTNDDDSWDAVWESAVKVTQTGWIAEFRIPLNTLRFSEQESATWGFNALRYVSRLNESSFWAPTPKSANRFVSVFGHLTGLSTTDAPSRYSALPYGAVTSITEHSGEVSTSQAFPSAGADLQYGITSDLTLDATVNPDFGQVEVDEVIINLTAFESYFPEKRPFFLEGAEVFETAGNSGDNTGTSLYYSRRIGFSSPILGAAKLTGQTQHGLSVGLIDAVTDDPIATFFQRSDPTGSPTTNYAVARIRQDFGSNSYVGVLGTAVNRFADSHQMLDAEYVAGTDTVLRTDNGGYSASAIFAGSHHKVEGDESNSATGSTGTLVLSKDAGTRFVGATGYSYVSPQFDCNQLGFIQRNNIHSGWTWLQLRDLNGFGPFQEVRANFNSWYGWLLQENRSTFNGANMNVNMDLKNFWFAYVGFGFDGPSYNPYEARNGQLYHSPADFFAFYGLYGDSRYKFRPSLEGNFAADSKGGVSFQLTPSVRWQVNDRIEANSGITARMEQNGVSYASDRILNAGSEQETVEPVFGARDLQQASLWVRGTVTFTKSLSLQAYGQLIGVTRQYNTFQILDPSGTGDLTPITGTYTLTDNPNEPVGMAVANAVLRWELAPGSAMYAVWIHGRMLGTWVDGAPLSQVLADTAQSLESTDQIVVKLSFRWGT